MEVNNGGSKQPGTGDRQDAGHPETHLLQRGSAHFSVTGYIVKIWGIRVLRSLSQPHSSAVAV